MAKLPEIIADLECCIRVNRPIFIWGEPGIGKSEAVAQVAAKRASAVTDIRLSTFDPVDLRGLPAIVDGLTKWMRPQIWPVDESRETILFFDEMDRAAPAVANAALQIVLDRRIGEFVLPASVRIVAAGNGETDRRTTSKIGSAQANRFTHVYAEADAEMAARHWDRVGVDAALSAFIRMRPELITTEQAKGEHGFGSPRAWAACDAFMAEEQAMRHRLCAGTVGSAPAGELEAFLRIWKSLVPVSEIVRNPSGAPVPQPHEIGLVFAISGALARKADHSNFAAVCTYAARLPRDHEIAVVHNAVRRDATLKETAAYIDWAVRNQDVQL